jgi:hypothetical protein
MNILLNTLGDPSTHEMRNEMHVSTEVALDRSPWHLWFVHRSGTFPRQQALCDQGCLGSHFAFHHLLAEVSSRIPWVMESFLCQDY